MFFETKAVSAARACVPLREITRHMRYGACCVALVLASFVTPAAFAQIPALTDTTCAGQRSGIAGGLKPCTASDFTSSATLTNANGASTCVHGQSFTADLTVTLTHSTGNTRYNIGFFTGEQANNPATTTSGNVCSAAAMPNNVAPWSNLDNNACGDAGGALTATPTITGIKILCSGVVGGNVQVPYLVVWDQSAGTATSCNGSIDVKATTGSKCNGGIATISNEIVNPAAELAIVKNVAISGNTVTYTLVITNNGPDSADGATYTDTVPNTVSGLTASCGGATGGAACGTQPNIAGQVVSGTVGTLPNGGSVTITISGTAANNAVVDNTASVAPPATVTDTNNTNNTSTATGTVGGANADVVMNKTVVFNANSVTYTLVVSNTGPDAADGATYTDTVPNTVTGIGATCGSPTGGAACGTQPNIAGQVVSGTVGTLPSGGSVTITITGTGATGANADNTASAAPPSGTTDPNNTNNSSTATGNIPGPSADVGIVKNVGIVGTTVTYTLVITNGGPAPADGETYSDNVPATVAISTATCGTPTGGAACGTQPNVVAQSVSGTIATLPNGGSVTITITGTAANNAVVDNTGSISPPAGTTDPNSTNDTSTATGTVGAPQADVSVLKSVVISGNTVTYTLLISNGGPASADLASYSDNVPATVAISTATCGTPTGGAACGTQPNVAGQMVSGMVGTLPNGGSVTITISGTAANGAVVDNTANVVAPTGTTDPNNANNSSNATGTVGASADVAVVKSLVTSGNTVTYTLLISNNGPNVADGATFTDNVPATVTLSGTPTCATTSGGAVCGTVNVAGNTVSGSVTTFPSNSSVTVTINGTTTNGATIDNTATVSPPSGTTDPTPTNNNSTATGTGLPVRLQSFDVTLVVPSPKPHEARMPK
jgi:uncharacterized repeat protein (TIGR01451 family)